MTCDEGGLRRAPASSVVWLVGQWSSMEPHLCIRERETRALKCKTLGGIHMQSTAAMHMHIH